jgi:hypothetical protein
VSSPQPYTPFELPQQLAPQPFACLTQGHYAEHAAALALSRMLRVYAMAARRLRKNRGTA